MVRIIKKLSIDVVELDKMVSKNTTMNFNKPSFKRYNNPPTRKTLTYTEEAHFGQVINIFQENHNCSKYPKEN
jgi:hypothetical protein